MIFALQYTSASKLDHHSNYLDHSHFLSIMSIVMISYLFSPPETLSKCNAKTTDQQLQQQWEGRLENENINTITRLAKLNRRNDHVVHAAKARRFQIRSDVLQQQYLIFLEMKHVSATSQSITLRFLLPMWREKSWWRRLPKHDIRRTRCSQRS